MVILSQNMDLEALYPIVEIFHSVQVKDIITESRQFSLDLGVVI